MVVNLNLNTQNLGTLYTDPTIGDNLNGSANLATQNEIGLYNPTDSISLSAMAQSYLDGQPAPEQVPETVEVTAWRKLSSEAGIDNSLMSDYDFQNLLLEAQNQTLSLVDENGQTIDLNALIKELEAMKPVRVFVDSEGRTHRQYSLDDVKRVTSLMALFVGGADGLSTLFFNSPAGKVFGRTQIGAAVLGAIVGANVGLLAYSAYLGALPEGSLIDYIEYPPPTHERQYPVRPGAYGV